LSHLPLAHEPDHRQKQQIKEKRPKNDQIKSPFRLILPGRGRFYALLLIARMLWISVCRAGPTANSLRTAAEICG
jgi:hypothetical protein